MTDPQFELGARAVDVAVSRGASYADARVVRARRERLHVVDDEVRDSADEDDIGISVRLRRPAVQPPWVERVRLRKRTGDRRRPVPGGGRCAGVRRTRRGHQTGTRQRAPRGHGRQLRRSADHVADHTRHQVPCGDQRTGVQRSGQLRRHQRLRIRLPVRRGNSRRARRAQPAHLRPPHPDTDPDRARRGRPALPLRARATAARLPEGAGASRPRCSPFPRAVTSCPGRVRWPRVPPGSTTSSTRWARYLPTDANPLYDDNPFRGEQA